MSSVAPVVIHSSQSAENIRRDLLDSLRTRRINHKFHYDSASQTEKWLALHQKYSPSRNDPLCEAVYDQAILAAANIPASSVHVLGLGCGGGKKDGRLLERLRLHGKQTSYTPCDVSAAMVRVAQETTAEFVSAQHCHPFVCDLATANDLPEIFSTHGKPDAARIVTFFGMIPNFEPEEILPKLSAFMRREDRLLFSANLAPDVDYSAGLKRILPQYDNELTRDWLSAFLFERGVDPRDGVVRFTIEFSPSGVGKVVARFLFERARRIEVMGQAFEFCAGESVQLFFSYRYTPELVRRVLAAHGIRVEDQWITPTEEEGVFLCSRD